MAAGIQACRAGNGATSGYAPERRSRRRCPVAAVADDETLLTQLKKAITEATRTHGYVECRAMRGWLLGIESVLDRTAGLITSI
jgi:hypothetical protein